MLQWHIWNRKVVWRVERDRSTISPDETRYSSRCFNFWQLHFLLFFSVSKLRYLESKRKFEQERIPLHWAWSSLKRVQEHGSMAAFTIFSGRSELSSVITFSVERRQGRWMIYKRKGPTCQFSMPLWTKVGIRNLFCDWKLILKGSKLTLIFHKWNTKEASSACILEIEWDFLTPSICIQFLKPECTWAAPCNLSGPYQWTLTYYLPSHVDKSLHDIIHLYFRNGIWMDAWIRFDLIPDYKWNSA